MTVPFVMVGGVPGAGKSTLLTQLAASGVPARIVDPDPIRRWFARRAPGLAYVRYRWLVHLLAAGWALGLLLAGPSRGPLLVHDPATRPRRRVAVGRLARALGWTPRLVFIDVSRADAVRGQAVRGRMVASFDRHWARWEQQRPVLRAAAALTGRHGPWHLLITDREGAATLPAATWTGEAPAPHARAEEVPAGT